MPYNYIKGQDKELPFDEFYFSDRARYQFYACDRYISKYKIDKMMNVMGVKEETNYTWFLYYFRNYTVNYIVLEVGKIVLEALEFMSFESTMNCESVTVTTDKEYFYLHTGYGKFKISKERSHCENILLLETKDWEFLMKLNSFSTKFEEMAIKVHKSTL